MSDKDKSARSVENSTGSRKRGASKPFNFAIKQNDTAYVPGSTKTKGRLNTFLPNTKKSHKHSQKDRSPKAQG